MLRAARAGRFRLGPGASEPRAAEPLLETTMPWVLTESPEGSGAPWVLTESPEGKGAPWVLTDSPEGSGALWVLTEPPEGRGMLWLIMAWVNWPLEC